MSALLGYSMFQDVLFPRVDSAAADRDAASFQLRRLKRFLPTPDLAIRGAPIIVFDLETTGLDFATDRIIEIGAQKLVGLDVVDQFESFIATDVELTDDIQKMTGIKPEMLEGQPTIDKVLPRFLDFIAGGILVAHNAEFDIGMIRAACSRLGVDIDWPCFCTLKMARHFLEHLESKRLDALAAHYGFTFESRHRAIGDIKVTASVLTALLGGEAAGLVTWAQMQPFTVS